MEERPLLTPDAVRRLNPDQAILIPERQNPLLVQRILHFQDPTFRTLFDAQSGPLPYPSRDGATMQALAARVAELERQAAQRIVIDCARPGKARAFDTVNGTPEPKLARDIARRWHDTNGKDPVEAPQTGGKALSLDTLKPAQDLALARMSSFSQKLQALQG